MVTGTKLIGYGITLTIVGYIAYELYTRSEAGQDTEENITFVILGLIVGVLAMLYIVRK